MSSRAWLVLAIASLFGIHFHSHPQVAYPCAALALWLLRRQLSPYVRIGLVLVAALSCFRGHRAIDDFSRHRDSLRESLGAAARCAGDGEVVESPVFRGDRFSIVVEADSVLCDGPVIGKHRLRLVGGPDGLARGDRVAFIAQLGPVAPLRQLELPDPIPRLASLGVVASGGALHVERLEGGRGVRHAIDSARNWVRRRILATYVPGARALGRALVLGENDLEADEQLAFQRSGLSHLLAVSGTHLVFAVVAIVAAMRAALLRWTRVSSTVDVARWVAPFGAVASLAYADFAGGSGSAFRAAWMLTAVYTARAFDRHLTGLRALSFSLLVGAICDPLVAFDVSFLLSALATSGLIVIGPPLRRTVMGIQPLPVRWFFETLTTTLAAMVPCTPLLLRMSPDVTLAGLVANVVAGPLGELAALPLCLIHAIAAPVAWLERGSALAGSGALLCVSAIAKISARQDWARVALPPPTFEQFAVMGMGVLTATTVLGRGREASRPRWSLVTVALATLLALAVLEYAACRSGSAAGKLRVTIVDVGQGDSILIDLPDGRLMLVDGGGAITGGPDPGQRVLVPLLRMRRRSHIDVAVLTHPHPDHFGGLLTVLREVPVREFWEAEDRRDDGKSELSRLRADLRGRGTSIRSLPELCARFAPRPGALIQVLGPCPNPVEGHSANDRSIVMKLELGRYSVLLSGDAERLEESELLATQRAHLHADLLKVGHHGSRSSTSTEWLTAIQPAMAAISVGLRNRFGHPHPTTLTSLLAAHVPVYRTDQLGSIEWQTDGKKLVVRSAATPNERSERY